MADTDQPRLMIPIYDLAMSSFMSSVIDGMIGVDPLLGQIPVRVTGHAGPTRNVPGPHPVDHPLTSVRETFVIHADVIRSTDVESFLATLTAMFVKYEEQMGKTLIQTLSDVTEAVGKVVDAAGRSLSYDLFLDALEKIEFSFDDDGRPRAKQVCLMNPATGRMLRSIEITPEQRRRHDEIIQRKKEQWDAQKRSRRLPRRDQGEGV